MAKTPSTMLPLGTQAPDFHLPDAAGKPVSRSDFAGQPLLVMFLCNHCPFVKHIRHNLAATGRDYKARGVGVVGINANDIESYPDDAPDKMVQEASEAGYTFAYLYDATQEVAKAYKAACTPDFFLFDASHRLVYRGQYDDSRPGNGIAVSGRHLHAALDAVLRHEPVPPEQRPSIGCNIKWRPGQAPAYFGNP